MRVPYLSQQQVLSYYGAPFPSSKWAKAWKKLPGAPSSQSLVVEGVQGIPPTHLPRSTPWAQEMLRTPLPPHTHKARLLLPVYVCEEVVTRDPFFTLGAA